VNFGLIAPQPLTSKHKFGDFSCGEPLLDDWLKRRALAKQFGGTSRTFVVSDQDHCVWGYYALAAAVVSHQQATGGVRRNMPDPVPIMILGRLAVDRRAQDIKLGGSRLFANLNQLTKAVNSGSLPVTPGTEAELKEACADFTRLRNDLLRALGKSPGEGRRAVILKA